MKNIYDYMIARYGNQNASPSLHQMMQELEVLGPSKIIYGGNDKPLLNCGARVVIETESDIEIVR